MKYSRKGHKDRNRHKNRIKRSGQARWIYVIDTNRNISFRQADSFFFFFVCVVSFATIFTLTDQFLQLSSLSLVSFCDYLHFNSLVSATFFTLPVPTSSPSRGGDVAVYVFDINQLSLPTPFFFCFCFHFCLFGPFNCISFHKFS